MLHDEIKFAGDDILKIDNEECGRARQDKTGRAQGLERGAAEYCSYTYSYTWLVWGTVDMVVAYICVRGKANK